MVAPIRPYLTLSLLLGLLTASLHAQAQLCGGGARGLQLYLPYGQPTDSLHYEVISLNESERTIVLKSVDTSKQIECAAWLIAPTVARQMLAARHSSEPIQSVLHGRISVPTSPHSDYPTMIHIFSTRAEAYVFSTFFCGCDNNSIHLVWGVYPKLMQEIR